MAGEEGSAENGNLVVYEVTSEYHAVSGTDPTSCVFLGSRRADGALFRDFADEAWILRHEPREGGYEGFLDYGTNTMLTGVYRSPSGATFVSGMELLMNPSPGDPESRWRRQPLDPPTVTHGVFGVADDCVFAWGESMDETREPEPRLFRFDGRDWSAMPSPGFSITCLHGLGPDHLVAGSSVGVIGRYENGRWSRLKLPTAQPLNDVFVADLSTAYGVGRWGDVFEGSEFGWGKIGETPRNPIGFPVAPQAIAWWNDALWVGAGPAGLLRRVGVTHHFEVVDPAIVAVGFDAREALLIAEQTRISATADGQSFTRSEPFQLAEARRDAPLGEL